MLNGINTFTQPTAYSFQTGAAYEGYAGSVQMMPEGDTAAQTIRNPGESTEEHRTKKIQETGDHANQNVGADRCSIVAEHMLFGKRF